MHIDLKLGLSCNNACVHCVMRPVRMSLQAERKSLDTPPPEIDRLVEELLAKKITSITLTGGEPTIRPDFLPLLARLARENLEITIQTNGRRLADAEFAAGLEAIPRERIHFVIALHSHDARTHDEITRRPNSFRETGLGIGNLTKLGFAMSGKMVLSNKNVGDLRQTLALYKKLGFDEIIVAYPHAEDFDKADFLAIAPRYGEVREAIGLCNPNPGLTVFWETIPFCHLPDARFYANSMDLAFLRQKLLGEELTIEMAMTGEKIDWVASRSQIKKKAPQCAACLLDKICEGAWAEYLDIYGPAEFSPLTDNEKLASFWERL